MANPQKENGYIPVANELGEALAKQHFTSNEWRVLWVVWRKTYGWNKKEDAISLTQFEAMTGLSRQSVIESLKGLVGKKGLEVVGKKGLVKSYKFNKNYELWTSRAKRTSRVERTSSGRYSPTRGGREKGTHKRQYKDNIKTNTKVLVASNYVTFKETWRKVYGKYPTGGVKLVDYPIQRLVKAYTIEKVCNAIVWAETNRNNNKFIPTFNNPLELERKWNSLVNQARKEKNGEGKRIVEI